MPIPDYQTLMLPVLRIAAKGESRVPQAAEQVADMLALTAEEREEMLPSGRQRLLHNRIHWAKFYMTKAGLIDIPGRGRFVASTTGRALLEEKPTKIDVELLKKFPPFLDFYHNSGSGVGLDEKLISQTAATSEATPEEQIDAARGLIHSALKNEILQRVLSQSPSFFEYMIVDLLVSMGYGGSHDRAALKLGQSGDGGVDGVIDEDRLGLDRIYIQAKRYASHVSVGRPEIQSFVGSLVGLGATKGVFVTMSSFSMQAINYARHLPQRVILIDGDRFSELIIEYNVGVRIDRTVTVKRVDEDYFTQE